MHLNSTCSVCAVWLCVELTVFVFFVLTHLSSSTPSPSHYSAHCSCPCILSCSECPGASDHHRPCTCPATHSPAHAYTRGTHHHASHPPDPDCHAQWHGPPRHRHSSAARSRVGLDLRHALRLPLHTGTRHLHPGVSHRLQRGVR